MVTTTTGSMLVQRRRQSFEEMDGESLIYQHPTKQGIYLNETATVIWRLCDGARSVDAIVAALAEIYPDVASDIASDVHDTIDRLIELGAVKFVDPAQAAPAIRARLEASNAGEAGRSTDNRKD
jgi:Coenzyme PQQ synthesis protein D (PqqD)